MGKIVLGNLLRHLVTLLIGFFVARHMLSMDVAAKLNAGDTVELWSGGWSISIKQVVDFLTVAVIPVLIPVLVGAWARIKERYRLIIARLSPQKMSASEVEAKTVAKSPVEIIKTVAAKP